MCLAKRCCGAQQEASLPLNPNLTDVYGEMAALGNPATSCLESVAEFYQEFLGARRSNQSILKEISPGISLEGMMLKLKLQYFGHLMR